MTAVATAIAASPMPQPYQLAEAGIIDAPGLCAKPEEMQAENVRAAIHIGEFSERSEAVEFACAARRLLHLEAFDLSAVPEGKNWAVCLGCGFQRLSRDVREFLAMWNAGYRSSMEHMRRCISSGDEQRRRAAA
jgi:hypothetical protein